MTTPGYIPDDFWRVCSTCGFQFRASQTFRTWDNRYVCAEDFETRHPQDFVRGRKDRQNVPNPRPEPPDIYIGPIDPIMTERDFPIQTESGFNLTVEG